MKKKMIILAAVGISLAGKAQTWKVDKMHAHISFTVTHLTVSEVEGNFKDFDATITASKPDFSDATFEFTANTNSVSTDNDYRDKDLKSDHFFDVVKYPTMTFASTSIKPAGKGHYKLTGNLTLHGVTKPVILDLIYNGTVTNPMTKAPDAGFTVSGLIKRSAFNFGSTYGPAMIGDQVNIKASGEFAKAN
jgi:polyisoprenoid-binding protein YceI